MKTTESKKAYELNITVNGKNSVIVNATFHGKMKLAEALNNAIYNSENYDVIIIRRNLNSEDALVINVAEYKAAAHDEYTATTDTKNIEKALLNIVKAYGKGDIEGNLNTDNTEETVDSTEEISEEIAEETAKINAADVKVNVADDGKIIEQIKVDVDTAINIINRLNYRNDTFVYRFTTREDNADIQYRHFDAYKANGEKDAFAITEIVINGKLEIVRFFNHFRNIIVDLQIGNVNYTIGDKGSIVLTAADEIADNNAAVEAESEIVNPCRFMVHVKYFSYEKGFIGYGGEMEDFATATAAAKWILAWTANHPFDTVTKDTVIYDFDNYAEEYRLTDADLNILNNSPAELDGSEEDIDGDNVFDYLPAINELNDVDIDEDDDNSPAIYSAHIYFYRPNPPAGYSKDALIVKDFNSAKDAANFIIDFAAKNKITAATIFAGDADNAYHLREADFNALYPPAEEIADNEQAKKEMARKITTDLNEHNDKRLQAGFKPIIPYASRNAHYHKLHGAAKWTVAYDCVNDTFGIWSEYGWHESGFSLGHEFCGWYKIANLGVIISRLTNAIDYAQNEFYFETDPALLKRTRRSYGKWQAVRAEHLKDKIDRDAQASEEIAAG